MNITRLLALDAIVEGSTGLALMILPEVVVQLLLGEDVSGVGLALARVAGIGLLSLALACWPGSRPVGGSTKPLQALLTYNLLTTVYLIYLGVGRELVGKLLWPVVAIHAVMTLIFARAWFRGSSN